MENLVTEMTSSAERHQLRGKAPRRYFSFNALPPPKKGLTIENEDSGGPSFAIPSEGYMQFKHMLLNLITPRTISVNKMGAWRCLENWINIISSYDFWNKLHIIPIYIRARSFREHRSAAKLVADGRNWPVTCSCNNGTKTVIKW